MIMPYLEYRYFFSQCGPTGLGISIAFVVSSARFHGEYRLLDTAVSYSGLVKFISLLIKTEDHSKELLHSVVGVPYNLSRYADTY